MRSWDFFRGHPFNIPLFIMYKGMGKTLRIISIMKNAVFTTPYCVASINSCPPKGLPADPDQFNLLLTPTIPNLIALTAD